MANERLRTAMLDAELTTSGVAHELGLDAKSVERWVTRDVVPHRNTAARAAALLRRPLDWLWPSMASGRKSRQRRGCCFLPASVGLAEASVD